LIVEKNNEVIFVGDEERYAEIAKQIPFTNNVTVTYDGGTYIDSSGSNPVLVKQKTFRFSDGLEGRFCIITDIGSMVIRLQGVASSAIFGSIMTIVFTALILVAWLFFGARYAFKGPDLGQKVNDAMNRAADMAQGKDEQEE